MKTVYIIEGNIKQRTGFLSDLKQSLGDYELFVFDKDNSYEYVSQMVTEISCFGERRLFIIKELPSIKIESKKKDDKKEDKKKKTNTKAQQRTKVLGKFRKLFSVIPVGNIVLFDNIKISSAPFLKDAKEYGDVHKYAQKITKFDAIKIINKYFSKVKIGLSKDISEMIADSLDLGGYGIDLDKLDLLLLKLYNYVYGKSSINKDDVYAICSTSMEFVVWTLYNTIESGGGDERYRESFKLVLDFLSNARYFSYEATMLIQNMLWRYGLLLMVKDSASRRISKQEIIDNISNIKKLRREGKAQKIRMFPKDDKPEYSVKMIASVVEGRRGNNVLSYYTQDGLLSIYHVISKSLVKIRSGCTESEIITLLQIILLTICGKLNNNGEKDGILEHKKMLRREV